MVVGIGNVHEVAARASGLDGTGEPVVIDLTASVVNAGDAGVAVDLVKAQLLNERVIPAGAGAFVRPQEVTPVSVLAGARLPVSPLVYKPAPPGADPRFAVESIHEVQVLASIPSGPVSTTLTVHTLNTTLAAAITLAKTEVLTMPVLQDPWGGPGQMTTPDTVIALSAKPIASLPAPWNHIILRT
jgi:hypothetical protein